MSAIRARHEAPDEPVTGADDLAANAQLLESALSAGGHRLDPAAARTARQVLARVGERSRLSGEHTVVALAGATGSGKSSLFNALAGLDIATVGVRRPTTAVVTSCTWGPDGALRLLDWLAVPQAHRVSHESALDAGDDDGLRGLVLLDLPDYDSTESAHRAEVDRLVELVDLFVWVTDPQKYADAALHRRYLSRLAGHDAVTLVVLNQADRLSESDLAACRHDLERLIEADGLRDVPVIATSAVTGAGVADLRDEVGRAVHRRNAWSERLAADVDGVATRLREAVADGEADVALLTRDSALADALAGAAGVPAVVHAIEAHYRRGARAAGGWPFTRWVARLRPDPLRRLRITSASSDDAVRTARSSLPEATPAQRARVELATRQLAEAAGEGLPDRWADAVRAAARPADGDLSDALDQAVLATDLGVRRPFWWRAVGAVQWALAAAAVAGGVWLIVLAGFGALRLPEPRTPDVGWVPVPTLLLLAGLALGALTGAVVGLIAGPAARRRADRARTRLNAAVSLVADERITGPIGSVLTDHRATRAALDALRARASRGRSHPG